jgi:hypothetical protein
MKLPVAFGSVNTVPVCKKRMRGSSHLRTLGTKSHFGFNPPHLLSNRLGLTRSDSEFMRPKMWAQEAIERCKRHCLNRLGSLGMEVVGCQLPLQWQKAQVLDLAILEPWPLAPQPEALSAIVKLVQLVVSGSISEMVSAQCTYSPTLLHKKVLYCTIK